jgi:hypothetical protein
MSKNNYLKEEESEIFWLDGFKGEAEGGIYVRAFEIIRLLERCKETGMKIVGIKFDDSFNMELIREKK